MYIYIYIYIYLFICNPSNIFFLLSINDIAQILIYVIIIIIYTLIYINIIHKYKCTYIYKY